MTRDTQPMFSETFYWSAPSNDWWRVSTYILSPKSDSAAPLTNGVHRVRLTGLSSNLTSETLSIDILGNTNRTATAIDRAAKTVTQTVQSPDSTNAAVSVTVNGLAMGAVRVRPSNSNRWVDK